VPFLQSTSRDQVLVTIEGAHHETFSNVADPLHPLIAEITTAWLLATLDHDEAARAFLLDGGLSARARVVVERK